MPYHYFSEKSAVPYHSKIRGYGTVSIKDFLLCNDLHRHSKNDLPLLREIINKQTKISLA